MHETGRTEDHKRFVVWSQTFLRTADRSRASYTTIRWAPTMTSRTYPEPVAGVSVPHVRIIARPHWRDEDGFQWGLTGSKRSHAAIGNVS